MTLDFLNEETSNIQDYSLGNSFDPPHDRSDDAYSIPSSGDLAGIELRMLPPFIRDNHTISFWPFPGRARLYCLTLVVSDAANQLTGLMDLNAFPRVGDKEFLPINKTIYYWQEDAQKQYKPPSQIHVITSIIKSKEALRETGDVLRKVKSDNDYQDLMDKLSAIITETASFAAVTNIAMQAAHIVGQYLGKVDDQPIGTVINSFTRLHGDWDRLGINHIDIPTRDVDFQYELIIRDQQRLDAVKAGTLILPVSYMPPPTGVDKMVPM